MAITNIGAHTVEKIKTVKSAEVIKVESIEEPDKSTKKVIGIVSYLPNNNNYQARQQRLVRLLNQIKLYGPFLPIMIIAQNGRDNNFLPKDLNITVYNYSSPLGILKARQELRNKFLETDYEQIIMFDDDAIISTNTTAAQKFLEECDKHPKGFMFLKGWKRDPLGIYSPAQLNGCVISRGLIDAEPLRDEGNPQEKGIYEDVVYAHLFHGKYPEYEFEVSGFQCVQWSNSQFKVASTGKSTQSDCLGRTRRLMAQVQKECEEGRKAHNK